MCPSNSYLINYNVLGTPEAHFSHVLWCCHMLPSIAKKTFGLSSQQHSATDLAFGGKLLCALYTCLIVHICARKGQVLPLDVGACRLFGDGLYTASAAGSWVTLGVPQFKYMSFLAETGPAA